MIEAKSQDKERNDFGIDYEQCACDDAAERNHAGAGQMRNRRERHCGKRKHESQADDLSDELLLHGIETEGRDGGQNEANPKRRPNARRRRSQRSGAHEQRAVKCHDDWHKYKKGIGAENRSHESKHEF